MRRDSDEHATLSGLLQEWGKGDDDARDDALGLAYGELRRLAAAYRRRERADHTLQPTALVHEAYVRLAAQNHAAWKHRGQLFVVTAQMMRSYPGRSISIPRRRPRDLNRST